MSNVKKVMPEDIDPELVERINFNGDWNLYSNKELIAATLAYLANNPLELTEKVDASLVDFIWDHHKYIQEWQRIAFLKKEPLVPEEVKQLLYDDAFTGSIMKGANEKIIKSWKIGAGIK